MADNSKRNTIITFLSEHGSEVGSSSSLEEELRSGQLENPLNYFSTTSDNPLIGKKFVDSRGAEIDSNFVLKDKEAIAIFFSCSYCSKNTKILPMLIEVYKKSKEIFKPFEIVYVSVDEEKEKMMDDFQKNHGHWFALDFDEPFRLALRYMYNIVSVPQVIVIDSQGKLITWRGLQEMQEIGVNVLVTWFD